MKIYHYIFVFVFFIFFTVYAIAADTKIVTEEVVYHNNGKDVIGYFARPDDNQKHKGIITTLWPAYLSRLT